jgi:hypothetical protein
VLQAASAALSSEDPELRPSNDAGKPGGLVRLHHALPTIIIPDLHARRGFLMSLLTSQPPVGFLPAQLTSTHTACLSPASRDSSRDSSRDPAPNTLGTVIELLKAGRLQILCLGDGFHTESWALKRWRSAFAEFKGGYREHHSMDQEMSESLGLMEMVMLAKAAFPRHFHFLKGNHENVLNETGDGNFSFYKFVQEGAMVRAYLDRFYGHSFAQTYAVFERGLPLLAQGRNFLASHAEPARAFTDQEVINAAFLPEVIQGLTWTGNDEALPGSVAAMLQRSLPGVHRPRYITGHRPIEGLFQERSGGLHLQIHNPDRQVVAWIRAEGDIEVRRDIGVIEVSEVIEVSGVIRVEPSGTLQ